MGRARAKHLTYPLAIALAELRSPLEKSYRNTAYCACELQQDETGRIRGHYCGNRWCLVCNRVRLAKAINAYYQPVSSWEDPQFVTLTIPNVPGDALRSTISQMLKDVVAIGRAIKRTDRLRFRALRKLECTFSPLRGDFHPHFHFVVEGRAAAEALLARWLRLHPEANPAAQDIRACDATSLKEMFKYFTKLVVRHPTRTGFRTLAPVLALDTIFQAMHRRRVFQAMGFKISSRESADEHSPVGELADTTTAKRLGEQVQWEWIQSVHDWVDLSSGEVLTGYRPTTDLLTTIPTGGGVPTIRRK